MAEGKSKEGEIYKKRSDSWNRKSSKSKKAHYFKIRKNTNDSFSLIIYFSCFASGFYKADEKQLSRVGFLFKKPLVLQ